ncbi:MAG: polysaccharide pyruvyl transferase family protein [Desulfobacterales bacterium]|nr:polysaccharide pyruvyl transferase family protein [Desulfobacterales bacterium]
MNCKNIIMVGHGGFTNRGCAAIVQCTSRTLRDLFPSATLSLVSHFYRADKRVARKMSIKLFNEYPFPLSLLPRKACCRIYRFVQFYHLRSQHKRRLFRANDAVLSIGGDNITPEFPIRSIKPFIDELHVALEMGLVTVLWGATLGPFNKPEYRSLVLPVLRDLDLIVVRDYESRGDLHSEGISDNVVFAPDPAFLLEPFVSKRVQCYVNWASQKFCLGVSISGFLASLSQVDERAILYAECLRKWIDLTGGRVLLVPHVVIGSASCNDYRFSKIVGRLMDRWNCVRILPPTLSASEYKAAVGACQLFMGSRMHATIAALSQCIPTLSLSYSRKAGALQQLMVGNHRFVCEISRCTSDDILEKLFQLRSVSEQIRNCTRDRMYQLNEDYERATQHLARVLCSAQRRRDCGKMR